MLMMAVLQLLQMVIGVVIVVVSEASTAPRPTNRQDTRKSPARAPTLFQRLSAAEGTGDRAGLQ
jgi:hypothetical protein